MENTVSELNFSGLRLYDLKGSLINRFVRVKESSPRCIYNIIFYGLSVN